MPTQSISGDSPRVHRAKLRRELGDALRTDADLDAFCLDHFPNTYAQFASGMDRQQKLNLLLAKENVVLVANRLAGSSFEESGVSVVSAFLPSMGLPARVLRSLSERISFLHSGAMGVLMLVGLIFGIAHVASHVQQTADGPILPGVLRSEPSGADIWDLRTGRLLGKTPWPIEPSLLPARVCLRHAATNDEVLLLSAQQLPKTAIPLRTSHSPSPEVCDVPIPILQ